MTVLRGYRTSGRLAPQINQPCGAPYYVKNGVISLVMREQEYCRVSFSMDSLTSYLKEDSHARDRSRHNTQKLTHTETSDI
jgi:hypothetical protein